MLNKQKDPDNKKNYYLHHFFNLFVFLTPPMLSQHSRSQALVKEEGCDRRGEPTLNLATLMEMKPERSESETRVMAGDFGVQRF